MAVFVNYVGYLALLSICVNFYECEVSIPHPDVHPIAENSKSINVVTIVATTDIENGTVNSYNVTSSPSDFEFADNSNGALSVKSDAMLDYETATNQTVVFTASDGNTTSTATVTVVLTDVNDNTPTFEPTEYSVAVEDNLSEGQTVATVTATDADGTDANNVITYTITNDSNTDDKFTVSSTGVVTVSFGKTLVRADKTRYNLTVVATDNGSTALSSSASLQVCVGKECETSGAAAFASTLMFMVALIMPLVTMLK